MIGIIGAMEEEVSQLIEAMENKEKVTCGFLFWNVKRKRCSSCTKWNWKGQYGTLHTDSCR